jgi:large subunit ribosomal protein L18
MNMAKNVVRDKRHRRVRSKVSGTSERPRVSVFRSNVALYVQVVDDIMRHTLYSASTSQSKVEGTKVEQALKLGEKIAKDLKKMKVEAMVFDRGGYKYHGRVKAVADGLRSGGIKI